MPVTDHADALPPGGDGVGVQPQRVDARVVFLQVAPEKSGQGAGHVLQRGVVDVHRALGEVVDQEVAYRGAGDALPVRVQAHIFPMTHHMECVAILEPAQKGR
ncbi:hypothetical protein [Streptomyces sp. NRRL F-5635]|uniref:hypothetical protein n=1 Tax=Streptomyces sp. NRRL F-5635 TaxID=1463865 RepID=UPI0004CCA4A4|nr:hypothetical protein [Streptomyces sp. NRRL F-5635]